MGNVCIFGGTFDPPHIGHEGIINHLKTVFSNVLVMPSGLPPHKAGSDVKHRLAMLRLCSYASLINTYELMENAKSYTVNTLEHFAASEEITLSIGGDSLLSLLSWYKPERIMQLARLYVIPRPANSNIKMLEQMAEFLRLQYGARVEISPYIGADISSTEIRIRAAFKDYSGVSEGVADYIRQHNLYTQYRPLVECLERYGFNDARMAHTMGVAVMAAALASKNNVNVEQAITAAILHDVGKYVTLEGAEKIGLVFSEECRRMPVSVLHAHIGAEIAKKEFNVEDEVYQAIKWHTTGRRGMSRLEKVIFAADAVEQGRWYTGVESLRASVLEDLEQGVIELMKNLLSFLLETGMEIDKNTGDALNALLEDC